MKQLLIFFTLLLISHSALSAAEPYIKTQVPWAVYLPKDAADKDGYTDASKFLHGDDVYGWYTYLVFKSDGTHITDNADLYDASGNPLVNEQDDYLTTPTTAPNFIICKFVLIQPTRTPSIGIDGSPDSSNYVNFNGGTFHLGHEEYALGYQPHEAKIENVSIGRDYWVAARETQKKLWRVVYGDQLHITPTGTLSQELNQYLTDNSETLQLAKPNTDFVVTGVATNADEVVVKHEFPVFGMNWDEVQEFFGKLSAFTGGKQARLPNEYEWEYAARAGQTPELPPAIFDPQVGAWKLVDPSDSAENALSIPSVFNKKYQPMDIPFRLVDEIYDLVTVGTNPDGSPIRESWITTLVMVADPRLETLRDWRIVVDGSINYDNRYPANMKPFDSRNIALHSNGTSFISVDINDVLAGGVKTGDKNVTSRNNNDAREFYKDENGLARAVNNYYIGVQEDGTYAARPNGGATLGHLGNPTYVYDPELVHHFVRMTGDSIWPPGHTSGVMTVNNTVLTYLHWQSFDKSVDQYGTFTNPIPLYDKARAELKSMVLNYSYPNSPGDYHEKNAAGNDKTYVPAATTIAQDYGLIGKNDKGSYLWNIWVPDQKNPDWKYVSSWTSHGRLKTENEFAGTGPKYPIDDFDAREKGKKISLGENAWGIEACLGNAAELCLPADQTAQTARWDGTSSYEFYTNSGPYVVIRGGSWNSSITGVRYSSREAVLPTNRNPEIGFRIVIEQ